MKHAKTQHPMGMLRDTLRSDQASKQAAKTKTVAQLEKLLSIEQRKVVYLQEQLRASKRPRVNSVSSVHDDNPFRLHF